MAGQETRLHAGTKQLTAFELWSGHGLTLVPAPPGRDWMQSTKGRAAMNCSANPGMGALPPGRAGHRDALWHATCTGLEFSRGAGLAIGTGRIGCLRRLPHVIPGRCPCSLPNRCSTNKAGRIDC